MATSNGVWLKLMGLSINAWGSSMKSEGLWNRVFSEMLGNHGNARLSKKEPTAPRARKLHCDEIIKNDVSYLNTCLGMPKYPLDRAGRGKMPLQRVPAWNPPEGAVCSHVSVRGGWCLALLPLWRGTEKVKTWQCSVWLVIFIFLFF